MRTMQQPRIVLNNVSEKSTIQTHMFNMIAILSEKIVNGEKQNIFSKGKYYKYCQRVLYRFKTTFRLAVLALEKC